MQKNMRMSVIASVAIFLLAVSAVVLMPVYQASAEKKADDPVVAIVNGTEIHKSQVMSFTETLPGQVRQQASIEQIYPVVIDQLINSQLISEKASGSGLEQDAKVKEQIENAKEQIIRNAYLDQQISKIVTDDKLKKEYDKFVKENSGKKETHARHILVKEEAEAKAIIAELEGGADFATLAKEKSTGPTGPRGGDLGYFTKEAMVPEFSKAAFEIKPGSFSKAPVKTQFGWHVIKVEDRRDQVLPKFDQVKPALKNKLSQSALDTIIAGLRKDAEIKRFSLDGEALQ